MSGSEQEELYALWMYLLKGIGEKTKRTLRQMFDSYSDVYHADAALLAGSFGAEAAGIIMQNRDLEAAKRYAEQIHKRNIHIVYPGHVDYPPKLLQIYDYPNILFIKGILPKKIRIHNRCIGIIGTRYPSVYGREIAHVFAKNLAEQGYCIISGLARGIDGEAHRGALSGSGYTVAVLGCGINVTYPREHAGLFAEIERNGAIVSEYGLDVNAQPAYFPQRNRIISGLSDGVVIVEAKKKSGSLITADAALEQGRQVYAVPGRITDTNSDGTNNLIKQGAMCVTDTADIIGDMEGKEQFGQMVMMLQEDAEEFVCAVESDVENRFTEGTTLSERLERKKNALAPMEKIVYSCLSLDPVYIDEIIKTAGLGITKVISVLYGLEEKGLIKQPLKGYYTVTLS